jgi:alkylated DNA repair dioxygenase AlkB
MDIRKYFKPINQANDDEPKPPRVIQLDTECWIEQGQLPNTLSYSFDRLWSIHPEEYGEVRYMGKVIKTPRWQQSYLRSYNFSGMKHNALPLPTELEPFYAWANQLIPNTTFNQVLVNWYANGNHYIGAHSDGEKQLVEHSPVISISLGQERVFRVRKKINLEDILDIPMPHNSYLIMCGKMQSKYLHEVPKVSGSKGDNMKKRINITFRVFKS